MDSSATGVVGEQLGRYQLVHKLATGGMAELFLARTSGIEGFEKVVVLKRILGHLRDNETFVNMFLDEARIAANLEHPNIVSVYDIGKVGEDYFFTMAYLHGEDLSAVLRESARSGRGVPLPQALYIIQGVCAGLHYAHEQVGLDGQPLDIVHRDVSTTNVMLTYDGGVKLLDFGIAKAASQSQLTQAGVRKGKASYMSPEQCRADTLDRRSDVFSIGIMLWELTTMRGLFRADNEMAVMNMISNKDATPPSAVVAGYPAELERIVMRALARDRDKRYQTARELQEELECFVRENRLGCTSGALARLMQGLFGEKPLPWAADGSLTKAGITLIPTTDPTQPGSYPEVGSGVVSQGAPTTFPSSAVDVSPPPANARGPLYAAAGALGTAAVAAVLWVSLRGSEGPPPEAPVPKPAATPAVTPKVADADADTIAAPAEVAPAAPPRGPCPEGMVLVDGGSFFMGADSPDPVLAAAGPAHRTEVAPFCLDLHEVTVADYHACSDKGECKRAARRSRWAPSYRKFVADTYSALCNEGRQDVDDHPINCVSWQDAQIYCRWRDARLPTEAEWERAARGNDGRAHPWGDDGLGPERLNACGSECLAWFRRSKIGLERGMFPASDGHVETAPVGSYPEGQGLGGLQDMAGNVAEWTRDDFAAYPEGEVKMPRKAKVVRGASFHSAAPGQADPAFRRGVPGGYQPHDVGFRCATEPREG
ncbi:MAG: bifunctional serine/threonine-protein kinase/formylglycine-generating enzyme family protein [Myxococcota bacterium]